MIIAKYKATILPLQSVARTGNLSSFFTQSIHISSQANVRDVYTGLTGVDGDSLGFFERVMSSLDRKIARQKTQRSASISVKRRLGANLTHLASELSPSLKCVLWPRQIVVPLTNILLFQSYSKLTTQTVLLIPDQALRCMGLFLNWSHQLSQRMCGLQRSFFVLEGINLWLYKLGHGSGERCKMCFLKVEKFSWATKKNWGWEYFGYAGLIKFWTVLFY